MRIFTVGLTPRFSHFVNSMTAPIASGWSDCRVGFAPTGKRRLCTAHATSRPCLKSVDHFVGALLEKQRHLKTNRLCGLEVYHHLELDWLLDRQIGGLCPFKDLVNVGRCPAIDVRETRPIEDQPACFDKLPAAVDRRQPTPCGKICDQTAVRLGQCLEPHYDCVRALVERIKSLLDVLALAHVEQS
jgi:hypothetical protein